MQDIVVGNKQFTDVTKPNEIVSLLLNDDELASLEKQGSNNSIAARKTSKRSDETTDETSRAVRDLWAEEGDDFFGHSGQIAGASLTEAADDDESIPVAAPSTRGRKRRGPTGAPRGRKPGPAKGSKRKHAGDSLPDDI